MSQSIPIWTLIELDKRVLFHIENNQLVNFKLDIEILILHLNGKCVKYPTSCRNCEFLLINLNAIRPVYHYREAVWSNNIAICRTPNHIKQIFWGICKNLCCGLSSAVWVRVLNLVVILGICWVRGVKTDQIMVIGIRIFRCEKNSFWRVKKGDWIDNWVRNREESVILKVKINVNHLNKSVYGHHTWRIPA